MRHTLLSVLAVLATCGVAVAQDYGFELPAVTEVAAGSTTEIALSAGEAGEHTGAFFHLEVAAPLEITNLQIDGPGTIFGSNSTGAYVGTFVNGDSIIPQIAFGSVTTISGTVATPGVVGYLSISVPADTPTGDYWLRTYIAEGGLGSISWLSGWGPPPDIWIDPLPPGQAEGIIRVIPEPTTALLLMGATALLRRRHG